MAMMPGLLARLPGEIDLLDLHALAPGRYPFLLESCSTGAGSGRYDILFAFPGASLTLGEDWRLTGQAEPAHSNDFLNAFDRWWTAEARTTPVDTLPFLGGWFVFLAYELARQIEPSLALPVDSRFPLATAVRIPAAVIRDCHSGQFSAMAEDGCSGLIREIERDFDQVRRHGGAGGIASSASLAVPGVEEDDPEEFLTAVLKAKEHIARGDVYQANISRQWRGRLTSSAEPWMVYSRLRRTNPAPFAGIAVLDGACLVSSSPERLVATRGGRVQTRPIAGTRPRTKPGATDESRRSELVANPKERAEHVMLIDLERNDLGRICTAGSIRVEDFMTVESYAHVHHIVSGVSGELRPGTRPGEVLRAMFPGGTITGCPKVRCMSIIRQLESRPRGPYTGSMGYVNLDGSCDFNILIRTIVINGASWWLSAGSGIVADSIPSRELAETRAKAKGMLLSLSSWAE